jgi:FMN-dependent oxidoreductase (nitrilotriacetate monooxygenase family)
MTERKMRLNFHGNWAGEHMGAWRPGCNQRSAQFQLDYYMKLAQTAERGLFDGIFYAAGLAAQGPDRPTTPGVDPVVLAAALAARTERIGLVATVSTTFNEPYNVARAIATLDHLSGGRAAWNVVTTYDQMAALNFGMTELPPKHERYERATEFVEVVLKLWESWEEQAFTVQAEAPPVVNESAVHAINHKGRYFNVRGPLQTPRSLQGRPLLFQAGASEDGKTFSARIADGIFCVALELEQAKAFYADMKLRVKAAGRNPESVHVLPGVYIYLGSTEEEAKRVLQAHSSTAAALQQLAIRLSTPADNLQLDETVPVEILDKALLNPQSHGHTASMVELFRRERLTVREFLNKQPLRGPHLVVTGVPEQIVEHMEEWFVDRAADGYNIGNLTHETLTIFVDEVVPRLQKRGLFRHEYGGATLRENFCGEFTKAS